MNFLNQLYLKIKLIQNLNLKIKTNTIYLYKSNQTIKITKNVNLIANILTFKTNKLLKNNIQIELLNNKKKNSVDFQITEKIYFK